MPLRGPNNPNTDIAVMNVLKTILPADTALASSDFIFIQNKYKMALLMSQSAPKAVHLSSGPQSYERAELGGFDGQVNIAVGYYSRWDETPDTIDDIWKSIAEDLERMKANAEDNDRNEYQGLNHTMGIAKITLDPYEGMYDRTFQGLTLVFRQMVITYNLLPYGV